jgi:peptidoglycan-associated lipoprotein
MAIQSNILRSAMLAAALVSGAACTQQTASAPPPAATQNPELAGAWYEVYFDTNSSTIDERGRTIVRSVAYVVANNTTTRVTVIGKTDSVGAQSSNLVLSKLRADGVREALINAGVPASRIDTSWTGETRQDTVTQNDTASRRNRVVDITVVKMAN